MEGKQFDFKSLAPKSDVDLTGYKEAFKFALSNSEVKNVAVTGSYGAGKSSVMETFKKTEEGKKYSYLHISLAHFEKTNASDGKPPTEEQLEHQLEGKIINQLVHKIPIEKIPDSRVSLRKIPDSENVIKWTAGILMGLILTLYLVFYKSMIEIETGVFFLDKICRVFTKAEWLFIAVGIEFYLLYQLIKYLVSAQMKNRFFKRICIKDSEIELFGEEKDGGFSYFDRYLDEIKYLLHNADIDVFVFEDIDRYNTSLIFEKLREINSVININRDKPIRFFYLIRDDLFVQKDRTKFFDFIIPILPVVSGHNSFSMFVEYMGEGAKLKRQFLKQTSLFIDDMRVLNNIYNEYQIYQQKLKDISVDKSAEKIFSLVAYKNLFPEDFICLQRREGYVADLFKEKEKQSEEKEKRLSEEIFNLENRIKELPENDDTNAYELERQKKEIERDLLNLKKFSFQEYVYRYGYDTLKDAIQRGQNEDRNAYNEKIANSLYGDLIKYLLSNGYIDENYGDFIAMFHDSDISQKDKKFVRAVLDNEQLGYLYPIENPEIVDDYLQIKNLESKAAISRDMFCFYMVNGTIEQKRTITNSICEWKEFDFIGLLLDDRLSYESWINFVAYKGASVIRYYAVQKDDVEKAGRFCAAALLYSDVWELGFWETEASSFVKQIVCKDATFFEKVLAHDCIEEKRRTETIAVLKNSLEILEWKIAYFEFDMEQSKDISETIYQHSLYEINLRMICQILQKIYKLEIGEKENHLYDKVVSTTEQNNGEKTPLHQYIENNMNAYIDMLIESNVEVDDSAENLVHMILIADEEHRELLVGFMNSCIQSVEAVNDLSEVNRLIKHNKLDYRPENVLEYYDLYENMKEECKTSGDKFDVEDLLIMYICQFPCEGIIFPKNTVGNYSERNDARLAELFVKICKSDEIPNKTYRLFIRWMNREWVKGAPSNMPENKVDILIEEKCIRMTKENLPGMRDKYPSHMKKFILCNIEVYVNEVIEAKNYNFSECTMLLEEDISDEYKTKLLSYTTKPISVQNDRYSESLVLYILNHNYDKNDFTYIINQDYQEEELQTRVAQIAEKQITEIIKSNYCISKFLCKYFLKKEGSSLSIDQKKILLSRYVEYFSAKELFNIMTELEMTEFLPIFKNKNPLIQHNESNKEILDALQENGYIGKVRESQSNQGFYRVYSKKNKTE